LLLAGDGETLEVARAAARDLGMTEACSFPGLVPYESLPALLGSLDVYVQSSRAEVMSTAVMQAMAVGLPVIATDVPGLRGMIRHGETGRLVGVGDVSALASAIAACGSDLTERARLGNNARAFAVAHWSEEQAFTRYETLVRSLRDGRRRDRVR
jgi:glycosyltransferase involved in cell wall biosynthesis